MCILPGILNSPIFLEKGGGRHRFCTLQKQTLIMWYFTNTFWEKYQTLWNIMINTLKMILVFTKIVLRFSIIQSKLFRWGIERFLTKTLIYDLLLKWRLCSRNCIQKAQFFWCFCKYFDNFPTKLFYSLSRDLISCQVTRLNGVHASVADADHVVFMMTQLKGN